MIALWFDEGVDEAAEEMKKETGKKKAKKPCACGRTVCCGKHKNGQCSCKNTGKERD